MTFISVKETSLPLRPCHTVIHLEKDDWALLFGLPQSLLCLRTNSTQTIEKMGSGEGCDWSLERFSRRGTVTNSPLDLALSKRIIRGSSPIAFNQRGMPVDDSVLGLLVSEEGYIILRLNHGIKVEITVNQGIRLQNNPACIIMTLSADGCSSGIIHPSGRVYQYGSRVEITAKDKMENVKFAKMSHKGISFSSECGGLVYLVDAAGCRSTTDVFSDMSGDYSVPIFRGGAMIGSQYVDHCMGIIHSSHYWITDDGVENWVINGIRISQAADGLTRVNRSSKYSFRTSPLNGNVTLSTPQLHCTASVGNSSHLFVKRGERRVHYDGLSFIVRNAGHSAGYDEHNYLKVY